MPLIVAPVAFQRVAHPDGEVGMARAAAAVGTVDVSLDDVDVDAGAIAATGVMRWFQLYVFRDEGVTRELVRQAVEHGFTALVLTVDTPVLGRARARLPHRLHDPAGDRGRLARPGWGDAGGDVLVVRSR